MREEELIFDWEKIQLKYVEYLKNLPYLGGAKDSHNAAICNGDYPAMELLHAGLIRKTTCANGTKVLI